MIRYIRTTQEQLTEAIAQEFATMPSHKGERPLRQSHVDWLTGKMEMKLFHPPRWAKAWLNGKVYRVNGQHSSTALASANGHFPKGLPVLIDEYACETDDDVADLFAQFDAKGSVRNDSEIIMATARQHPELDGVKPTPIRNAVIGITASITRLGDVAQRISAESKRALVADGIGFILWSRQFTGTDRLRATGTLAALFDTYKANETAATEFWRLVREESAASAECPTRKLGRFLSLLKAGQEFNKNKAKPWSPRAVYSKCIHAWNAHRRNQSTNLAHFEDSPLPDVAR